MNPGSIKITLSRLLCLLCIFLIFSCNNKPEKQKKVLIGFSLSQNKEGSERWQRDFDFFVDEVQRRGGDVIAKIADADDHQQIAHAKEMIDAGVSVLVVMPHDSKVAAAIVNEAHKVGVKVIAYDRLIRDCDLDYYISFNNERVGELQADYLTQFAPKGNYVLIGGSPADNNAHQYRQGQLNVLDPYIKKGDINIIMDKFMDHWKPSEAYLATLDILSRHQGKIDAILAANDALAGGVITALQEKGMGTQVMVTGQDADLAACRRVLEGSQTMTVYKSVKQLSTKAAQLAIAVAKREKIPYATAKINNGKINVPSVLLMPVTVEKYNMEGTVIMDGYHTKEDIYGAPKQ